MVKNGNLAEVQEPRSRLFTASETYEPLPPERVVGVDTESFKVGGVLSTTLIPIHTWDRPVMLELEPGESPLPRLLGWLLEEYGQHEDRPSRTAQRPKEVRKERRGRSDGRDGRRESVEPVVLVWYNAEYDLGRLMEKEEGMLRAVAVGEDSVILPVGPYSLEIAFMVPTGSAPSFEWYIRGPKRVCRVIGRDMWGYWKGGLDKTAQALKSLGVTAKIKIGDEVEDAFERDWLELSEEEKESIKRYALQDSKTTREIYTATVELLRQIDVRVIRRDGTIPASAPGAAAKIMFQRAFDVGDGLEEWPRPPKWASQLGLDAYAGGRVFCRRPGPVQNLTVLDITSAYPDAMRWLPDPARCRYKRVRVKKYRHENWRGKWGVLVIDGEGLDAEFPALRVHDMENNRLRYVYGTFEGITATIPEIVLGVESGRLRVDRIRDGVLMEGSPDTSFLRSYVNDVFHLKETAEKDSAVYLMAKLLLNSPYGKLIEVRELHRAPAGFDGYYLFPNWVDLKNSPGLVEHIRRLYVTEGLEGLEKFRLEMRGAFKVDPAGPSEIPLRDILTVTEYHAGHYFLPLHAANVTGFVSAKLGLAAWCTDSYQGDTDSIFTVYPEGLEAYHALMESAGYPAPAEGLGSFSVDIAGASGVLVKTKMYSLRAGGKFKQAHHGVIKLLAPTVKKTDDPATRKKKEQRYLHGVLFKVHTAGGVEYETKPRPVRLRRAVSRGLIPGEFYSEVRRIVRTEDPNMRQTPEGLMLWKSEEERRADLDEIVFALERRQAHQQKKAWAANFRRTWLRSIGRIRSRDHDRIDIPAWCRAAASNRKARPLDEILPAGGVNPLDGLGEFSPGWIDESGLLDLLYQVSP